MPRFIDPPEGWKYGFPKVLPDEVIDVLSWLVEQGYPQKIIDDMGDNFYCRHWNEPTKLHPDPDKREWYYDGDGQKRHKETQELWQDESDDRAETNT